MNTSETLNRSPILDALPVETPSANAVPPRRPFKSRLGWGWRLAIGVLCGMSTFTAIFLVGWLNRLVQGRVLRAWWKESPLQGTFEEFTATLGPDAPTCRPRWILRENFDRQAIRAEIGRPTPDGDPPGWIRQLYRILRAPFAGLFENFRLGVLTILATFLLAGWGTILMTFSWEFGWLNSFTKGYEVAFVGPMTGIAGLLLFTFAMLYVPMAQIHMAVTGDFRAFFEFRFVWRLIRARLLPYLLLAVLFLGFGLVQEALKTAPYFLEQFVDSWNNASDALLLQKLRTYYLWSSAWLLLALLVTRLLAARIYRSAVLKVIRLGRVEPGMLHPRLSHWLTRLQIYPQPLEPRGPVVRFARANGRWIYRRLLFPLLFLVWLAFGVKTYIGEFLHYHPYVGFLNQPLVMVPCVNYTPWALQQSANAENNNP